MKEIIYALLTFLSVVALLLLILLWQLGILGVMINCDRTDYSPIIKKVAIPMQEELEVFYTKNKRFPTAIERNEMLEKVGCVMEGGICVFEEKRMKTSIQVKSYKYTIEIDLEKTGCRFSIQTDGNHNSVSCGTSPCISLKQ